MRAEELINHRVPPLKMSDDAHKAILWMEELRCNQLPVVDSEKFLGLISEDIILEQNDLKKKIADFDLICERCYVSVASHFYEVIKTASENNVQTVGVLDKDEKYCGVITVQDTIAAVAQSISIKMPGGILILSMEQRDYSLSEISRLVEENNAKIISSNVIEDPIDRDKIKVTIKINTHELNRIVATLERFGYHITGRFEDSKPDDSQREKLDMLFKYLEI